MSKWSKFALIVACCLGFGILMEIGRNMAALPLKILFATMGGCLCVGLLLLLDPRRWRIRQAKPALLLALGSLVFGNGQMFSEMLPTVVTRMVARMLAVALAVGLMYQSARSARRAA